jgi:hypothetical protein
LIELLASLKVPPRFICFVIAFLSTFSIHDVYQSCSRMVR